MGTEQARAGSVWQKIAAAKAEIAKIGEPEPDRPEIIDSTNTIRINDVLRRSGRAKSELIGLYEQYAASLEEIIDSALKVQTGLVSLMAQKGAAGSGRPKKKATVARRSGAKKGTAGAARKRRAASRPR